MRLYRQLCRQYGQRVHRALGQVCDSLLDELEGRAVEREANVVLYVVHEVGVEAGVEFERHLQDGWGRGGRGNKEMRERERGGNKKAKYLGLF